jgi:hypothetical protein
MIRLEEDIWRALVLFAWLFLLGAILIGCSGQVDLTDEWCAAHRCDFQLMKFDPEPGLTGATDAAVSSLNEASGLRIARDPARGMPIVLQPRVFGDSVELCGYTTIARQDGEVLSIEIEISASPPAGCVPQWEIIRHEIACHALNPWHLGPVDEFGHTDSGVCAQRPTKEDGMDDISLAALCAGVGGCYASRSANP